MKSRVNSQTTLFRKANTTLFQVAYNYISKKMKKTIYLFAISLLFFSGCRENGNTEEKLTQGPWDDLLNTEFVESYPTEDAAEKLYNEMLFQARDIVYMHVGSEEFNLNTVSASERLYQVLDYLTSTVLMSSTVS